MKILIATLHVRPSAQAVPLAAGCLKACLPSELQQQTKLIDLFPDDDTATLCRRLLDHNPEIIAFSLYVWNRLQIVELAQILREQQPDITLLAGGPEASADSLNVIRDGLFDGIIRGEGEVSFAQLISHLTNSQDIPPISGFIPADMRGGNLPAAAVCANLSALSSPWLTGQIELVKDGGVLWEVARGCQFNCAFCYDAKGHQGVRPLPTERLKEELKLFAKKQVAQIWILDSTFNAPPERGKQLLQMILEIAPQIHYHIEAKADFLDSETIELLAQLSCSVQIGLQSATAQVLKPLHRNLNPRQMEQQLREMSLAGITFGLDLIYGLPGDDHHGLQKSLDFTLRQQPNQLDIFPLSVLPGTELFDRQIEFGIRGELQPPYRLLENSSYSASDLEKSQFLAAATEIFYNRGRAVGFFMPLCNTLHQSPSSFLQQFGDWLKNDKQLPLQKILDTDNWRPAAILPLQVEFVARQLLKTNKKKLIKVAEDLISFHYLCAETLLAEDCQSAGYISQKKWLQQHWQLNPAVQIQKFNYALEDLETAAGKTLEQLKKQLAIEPGQAIFLRQQGEIVIEALDDTFANMLLEAKQKKTGHQLTTGIDPQLADELLEFAIGQGLLLPV